MLSDYGQKLPNFVNKCRESQRFLELRFVYFWARLGQMNITIELRRIQTIGLESFQLKASCTTFPFSAYDLFQPHTPPPIDARRLAGLRSGRQLQQCLSRAHSLLLPIVAVSLIVGYLGSN